MVKAILITEFNLLAKHTDPPYLVHSNMSSDHCYCAFVSCHLIICDYFRTHYADFISEQTICFVVAIDALLDVFIY
jgi:hypothetical protein